MAKTKIFSTRDLYLASALVTLKFYVVNIDYQIEGEKNQPVGYFNFEETPELKEAEKKYWQGLLSIEPRTYINNMRGLKAQVIGTYKGPRVDRSQFKTMAKSSAESQVSTQSFHKEK